MAQKITGALYSSWPMIFLTVSPSGGTIIASVYAVYNSVFMILKALLHGVIDAPRLGFGDMLASYRFILMELLMQIIMTSGLHC